MKQVVLVAGKAKHGKNKFAEYCKEWLEEKGERVLIAGYADLLKYICKQYFGWDGEKDEAGRTVLQRVGTDIVRAKCPDFWAGFMKNLVYLFQDEWDYVFLIDCRFENEVDDWVFPSTTVHVERENYESDLTEEQKNHPSEHALDNYEFDYMVTAGDLKTLKFFAEWIMDQIYEYHWR